MKKQFYIKTYGCQMNEYDSDKVRDILQSLNYEETDVEENSHLIIINTCAIREKSTEKLYSQIGKYKDYKSIICVMGCVAQAQGEEIMKRASYVDIVLGSSSYHKLPEALEKLRRKNIQEGLENNNIKTVKKHESINKKTQKILDNLKNNTDNPFSKRKTKNYEDTVFLDFEPISKFDELPKRSRESKVSEFLSIQEGCDKFCNFCVVPYTRGKECSRDIDSIIEECKNLVSKGAKEITLLGQNVSAYIGYDKNKKRYNMGDLLRLIDKKIPELLRIRYTTSHPRDMNESLINAHRDIKKLMPFLHLPVQSGSDNMLKKMNRRHKISLFKDIVKKLREVRPGMQISSDFIVGYPEETDRDFQDTIDMVKEVLFTQAFSFKYSIRPGTPAGHSDLQVPEQIKDTRLQILQEVLKDQQLKFNKSFEGTIVEILVESVTKNNECNSIESLNYNNNNKYRIYGKTEYNQSVLTTSENKDLLGKLIKVKINNAFLNSLRGNISLL